MSRATRQTMKKWEQVAAQAAQETDPQKLLQLASELNLLLAQGWKRSLLQTAAVEQPE
jgi:hypothetical protein